MSDIERVVIVRHMENGDIDYLVAGDDRVRVFIVDERAPGDRVFEWTRRCDGSEVEKVLGDSPRGHSGDERHAALTHKIERAIEGRKHLEIVTD